MAQGFTFGKAAAERIKRAVHRIEAMPYPRSDERNKYPVIGGSAIQYVEGIVTNSITACNGTTYGTGTVQPYRPSLNTNTYVAVVDNSFANSNSNSVVCLNFSVNSGTVNTNTHVGMIQRNTANGSLIFELIWRDC